MPDPVQTSAKAARPDSTARRTLPDLRALEAFVTVNESGSMALAARRLGVSPSAVSQLVRSLELSQGLVLFDRGVRPARPTREGHELLELAVRLLSQARALTEQLRAKTRQNHAQLRIGCVDSFAATIGPALIRALSGSARQLQLWSGLTPGLAAQLKARELDLAICTDPGHGDDRISRRPLFSEAWVAVFPVSHAVRPLRAARELGDVVGDLPLIRYSQRSVIGQQLERYLGHLGLVAPRRFEFDATDPLMSLVGSGLGWALSTPLCLWQSRQYLDQVTVLTLPPARLGRRDFFLLAHDNEWLGLDQEVQRVTRSVLTHETVPAIRRAIPTLPQNVVSYPEDDSP